MRTERIDESCPECGSPYVWRVEGRHGVTLECARCSWWATAHEENA